MGKRSNCCCQTEPEDRTLEEQMEFSMFSGGLVRHRGGVVLVHVRARIICLKQREECDMMRCVIEYVTLIQCREG